MGAGGIIRDSKGQWVAGFSSNDGKGDVLFAELFGVYHGLALIVNNSISNMVCETDAEEVVQLLRSRDQHHYHAYASLLVKITTLIDVIPQIVFQHVLREGNKAADALAKLGRRSSLGTHAFHWYFTSALPRSLLAAYPLFVLGVALDRRVLIYIIPVLSFVLLYSKLPHKELRFISSSLPMFNLSAAIAASRIYNNRKKSYWKYMYIGMLGLFVISLGCTIVTFMASYENYPSGYAIRALHKMGHLKNKSEEVWVHIDTFSAINGISRFCEDDESWRYSKEEGIPLQEFKNRNFTYLLSEHALINGYKCLFSVKGFSGVRLRAGFPPILLVKKTKVYVHGNAENEEIIHISWRGC
ncbi:dolichyl-P-Man:Man(7)GlcNAc(2)-PP-dolichol alpha-1,6-mannosyltransferase [Orobanche minor]